MTTELMPLTDDQGRDVALIDRHIAALCREAAAARSLVELETVSRKRAALGDLLRRAKAHDAAKFQCAVLGLEIERQIGRTIAEGPKARGTRGRLQPGMRGVDTGGSTRDPPEEAPTLAAAGIGKARAACARELHKMGEVFDAIIDCGHGLLASGSPARALSLVTVRGVLRAWRDEIRVRDGGGPKYDTIIRPTDNWTCSNDLRYPRLDKGTEGDEWGYIPGDILCNVLWYFSRPGDVVVDPMAGSGMLRFVYEDRAAWMWPDPWSVDLRLFDLSPRGLYAAETGRLDVTSEPLPLERVDLIVLDPPYFGIARGQYGGHPANLANLGWSDYLAALARAAAHCAAVQPPGGRLVLMSPDFADVLTGQQIAVSRHLDREFQDAGYQPLRTCSWSRRVEGKQHPLTGRKINQARGRHLMMTDRVFVLSFLRV